MDRRDFLLAAAGVPFAFSFAPRALAGPRGGTPLAFVTADLESHVVVLDLTTRSPVRRIRTGPGPRSIEGVLGRTGVVAHTEHGVVSLLDSVSARVRGELERFEEPRYTAVSPPARNPAARPIAYVTDSAREEVVVLDVDRGKVLTRVAVPGPARHISISPDGRTIWTSLGTKASRVAVLDAGDPRRPGLVRTFAPPFLAHDVGFAPDGEHAWVTSGSERRIAVYRVDGRRLLRVIAADAPPQHVTFVGRHVFVASGDDGTVRRHTVGGRLLAEARVPTGSYNVTFGWQTVITPSLGQGTLSVLDTRGRVRGVRRVARAAHDACVLVGP
jgi:DNA-binding beta-propeller fold protein YncE